MPEPQGNDDISKEAIKYLVSTPQLAVPLFFMWLCGIVLSFLFIKTNPKFEKHEKVTNAYFFNLAVGFLPGAVILIFYHFITHRKFLCTLPELSVSALPASLILAGITCIILFWKAIKS